MLLFNELEKETDDIVILDTNIVINLEQRKCSQIDLSALTNIFNIDVKPFITDLSFCELIIGSRNLSDFQFHYNELNQMEFMICGSSERLGNFLSTFNYDNLNSDEQFDLFKQKIIELKNNALFPIFSNLFHLYVKTCIMVFHEIDAFYWYDAFLVFNYIFSYQNKELDDVLFQCYETFVDDKEESKKLVKNLFYELITNLLIKYKPNKYFEEDIKQRLTIALKQSNFSILFKKWRGKNNLYDKYWLNKVYIMKTREMIDSNDVSPILTDGTCFILSKIIFDNANYNAHDLVDLFNISFASNNHINVHYYTNDFKKKWSGFVEIEKSLRPHIKLLFNELK